jgi:hypothetical protein
MTLADRLYIAKSALSTAEDELTDSLGSILGNINYQTATYDEYDHSFELFCFTPYDIQPTMDQLTQIWALGFERFWIHKGDKPLLDRSGERYFYRQVKP